MNKQLPDLLTVKEVSHLLRVHIRTVQRLSKQGKIRAIKIGNQWRYKKPDIIQYREYGIESSNIPALRNKEFVEHHDRRSYPRINSNLKCYFSVNLPPFKNINSTGIIENISACGILLICSSNTKNNIKVGDPISLDFYIPASKEMFNIKPEGRIVRKNNNRLGIKFRNISNKNENTIIQYTG